MKDDDVDVGTGKTPRREKANDPNGAQRVRNGARGGRRTERATSPADSLLSVTSHVPVQSHSRQPTGNGTSRNGTHAANHTNKRSRLNSVTSNATDQFEPGRSRELYNNQPPTSSSLHPSLPLPYANGHNIHAVPGAEWALNNNQLEGPGMPVARGNSHPMGVSTGAPIPGAVNPQADNGVGGDGEGDGDDNKTYCFCDGVSYGEMIACDDRNCEREWFHLACIGLTVPPDGTWYCDVCRNKRTTKRAVRGGRRRTGGGRNGTKT